jgi:hypothetical protein
LVNLIQQFLSIYVTENKPHFARLLGMGMATSSSPDTLAFAYPVMVVTAPKQQQQFVHSAAGFDYLAAPDVGCCSGYCHFG